NCPDVSATVNQNSTNNAITIGGCTDPNGDTVTCATTPTSGPAWGTATIAADCSSATYTPNTGYTGPDSFVYQGMDNSTSALTDTGTVSITVTCPSTATPTATATATPTATRTSTATPTATRTSTAGALPKTGGDAGGTGTLTWLMLLTTV